MHDEEEECPYLPAQRARFPFRLPVRPLLPAEMDARLAQGDRRNGPLLYRPSCAGCDACRAIRLHVEGFEPRSRHRRVLKKGDSELVVTLGPTQCDPERVALYNLHLEGRGLTRGGPPMDLEGYRHFLAQTCCESFELRYHRDGKLVGVAITDRSTNALSAVYCYYDPSLAPLSIGTYSILKQLELCRVWGLEYLYLGLYVVGSRAMAYKARFVPNEQLIDGAWTLVTSSPSPEVAPEGDA